MTAQIIPFPQSSERQIKSILGNIDYNELLQIRADLVERLFQMVHEGNIHAQRLLEDIGGKTIMEQVVDIHQAYPYWNEWKSLKRS